MPQTDSTTPLFETERAVSVLLPTAVVGPYDYLVPEEMELAPGDYVHVPLGKREMIGVVWGPAMGDVDPAKLRPVDARVEAPPMPEQVRRFVDWVSAYTLSSRGAVLRMAMRSPDALAPPKPVVVYRRSDSDDKLRLTPARQRVLTFLEDGPALSAGDLARETGVSSGVIKGLVDAGALEKIEVPPPPPFEAPDLARPGPSLSEAQENASAQLREKIAAAEFSVQTAIFNTSSSPTFFAKQQTTRKRIL